MYTIFLVKITALRLPSIFINIVIIKKFHLNLVSQWEMLIAFILPKAVHSFFGR
jgi:hypothetical protein